jgi:transposase
MGYVQGEGRTQATLFPVTLEELISDDHVCRVIDAFVDRLDMAGLGFERAEAAETGRPGYDPRDLLKLYLYGYLQQIRSSRRLESACRRNIELMWLLGRLAPDHKTIAEFRRMHREGVTAAGAELVRLARSVGLVKGEWVAIDGSKFQAVSSVKSVHEREALERYLEQLEQSDEQDEVVIDPSAVASALEKLHRHPEPEVAFMRTTHGFIPAYNVQAAVDAERALIVAQQVTVQAGDNGSLQPMAEAAQAATGGPAQPINVVADAGYSNGKQAEACEAKGILPHVPANRGVNSRGDGTLFDRTDRVTAGECSEKSAWKPCRRHPVMRLGGSYSPSGLLSPTDSTRCVVSPKAAFAMRQPLLFSFLECAIRPNCLLYDLICLRLSKLVPQALYLRLQVLNLLLLSIELGFARGVFGVIGPGIVCVLVQSELAL